MRYTEDERDERDERDEWDGQDESGQRGTRDSGEVAGAEAGAPRALGSGSSGWSGWSGKDEWERLIWRGTASGADESGVPDEDRGLSGAVVPGAVAETREPRGDTAAGAGEGGEPTAAVAGGAAVPDAPVVVGAPGASVVLGAPGVLGASGGEGSVVGGAPVPSDGADPAEQAAPDDRAPSVPAGSAEAAPGDLGASVVRGDACGAGGGSGDPAGVGESVPGGAAVVAETGGIPGEHAGLGAAAPEEAELEAALGEVPADLAPALDAVAGVGRGARVADRATRAAGLSPGIPRATDHEAGVVGAGSLVVSTGTGAPGTRSSGPADPDPGRETGRWRPVIADETTAPIPVHLLFRDDGTPGPGDPGGPGSPRGSGGSPGGFRGGGDGAGAVRRPPVPPTPRAPQPRSERRPYPPPYPRTPVRPAPLADARLAERPGPVLPGWAALLTGVAGLAGGFALLAWRGALPDAVTGRFGLGPRPYTGLGPGSGALLVLLVTVVLLALGGLWRGRVGQASVLTLFGDYRGSVRRTGLLWVSPLLRRRRMDVRLRHWRSEPLPAVDASGTALRVVVLVIWRVEDTARAALGVADHERYLRDQVEAALARVLSQLPADAFHEETRARTLRDAEAVGDALTRMLKADCLPVGIDVYSAQPTAIEYAPEVAAAMHRRRVAAIDARHRDSVLTSVVDAVDDTVHRLTGRGIVELDAYEHKALVRDLTVAYYTGRCEHQRA